MVNKARSKAAKKGWETRRLNLRKLSDIKKEPHIKTWFGDTNYLEQIYESGLEYAYVNASGEQCHQFAFCKDFLQDAMWATLNKTKTTIYNFKYGYGDNPPLDLEKMRLAVRLKGTTYNYFENKCKK